MAQAKAGDTVRVHYTGKLADGAAFHTSTAGEPIEFTIGDEDLLPDFEQAIIGMSPGELKTITIPADRAFGQYHDELVTIVDRSQFPQGVKPAVGQRLNAGHDDGRTVAVTVTEVSETNVTLDANHPLAGEDLTFDIQLLSIV